MVATLALAGSGCLPAACDDSFVELDGRCFDPKAECEVKCGAHEVCDITTSPNACHCAAGFSGDPCVWTGVVADPSFQRDPDLGGDRTWIEIGALVNPDSTDNASETGDGGEAEFRPAALCNASTLEQGIEMPAFEAAGPLVAELVYRADSVRGLAIGFDDTWTRLPPTGSVYVPKTFCLGEAAYGHPDLATLPKPLGAPVMLRLSASERLESVCRSPSELGTIRIDYFNIRPLEQGEDPCPAPANPPATSGTLNGQAEAGRGGWRFECFPEGCSAAGFEADVPHDRDSVARISRAADATERVRMTTQVSVPLPENEVPPALAFWWAGSVDRLFPVEIGTFGGFDENGEPDRGRALATLVGREGGRNSVYCLPPWTHGAVIDLSFALPDDGLSDEVSLAVDNVQIVSASACSPVPELLGFESKGTSWAGSTLRSIDQLVSIVSEPGLGPDSDSVLELSYALEPSPVAQDADLSMEAQVMVPAAGAGGGPAVAFSAFAQDASKAHVEWLLGASCTTATTPCGCRGQVSLASGAWERNLVCLPADWSGRWYPLQITVEPSGSASVPGERSRVLIDDIEPVTSADCDCR